MDDFISRQAAIDAILHNQEVYSNNFGDDPIDKYTIAIIDNDAQTIAQLPSAQPERIRGRWEIYVISMLDGEGCKCSECGFEGVPYWDFCPNCGADMRDKEDQDD